MLVCAHVRPNTSRLRTLPVQPSATSASGTVRATQSAAAPSHSSSAAAHSGARRAVRAAVQFIVQSGPPAASAVRSSFAAELLLDSLLLNSTRVRCLLVDDARCGFNCARCLQVASS